MDHPPATRAELLKAAHEEATAGNHGLASLLAEEAAYLPNSPAENAQVARDLPGGLPRES